jgi:hypothetical protein
MRKIFWAGVVAAMCMAAGTYFAAQHIHHHPDSTFAVCTTRACQVAVEFNPLCKLVNMFAACRYQACPTAVESACYPASPPFEMTAPWGTETECEMPVSLEPISEGLDSLAGIDPVLPPLCWPGDRVEPMQPPAVNETNFAFRTPPVCGETEECEDVHAGKPPACREAPEAVRQYPGCPYQHLDFPPARCCDKPCELIAAPTRACPQEGGAEEQEYELIPPPKPVCPCPDCCEGCCKSCAKCQAAGCCHKDCCESCPKCQAAGCCHKDCDKCPKACEPGKSRPRIDTTEFRPTDAKKGEFDPIPF